jgi:integrase
MAKHRTGHLFKRGSNFYVRWAVGGKVFSKALRDTQGEPITNRRAAEEAKLKLMAPFIVADEASALESIAAKIEGRKAELARLENELNPPMPIADAWREYLECANRPDTGESTLRQYQFQFGRFARWIQEKHPEVSTLRSVTKAVAEEYAGHLNHGRLSPNTYNKHLNLLTLVFRVLKRKAKLTENVWDDIQRKRIATQGRRELTIEELRRICQSATGELRTLLSLGVYTGLRLGDCATLRWAEVDLLRTEIRRIPNKTARRNPKPVKVPVHSVLREMLAETPSEKRTDYVLPKTAELYNRRSDLVTDMVQRHFEACGIKPHKPGTGSNGKRAVVEVGFHSLRHTFVSLCRESNAPLAVVESIVGHSNPAMTRHYTHVGELAAGQAIALLPAIIGEQRPRANESPEPKEVLLKARCMIESMSAENWQDIRVNLLSLLP